MSMNPSVTYRCHYCKKIRPFPPTVPSSKSCLRCKMKMNKVFLLNCFDSIVTTEEMVAFKAEMNTWYLNDV